MHFSLRGLTIFEAAARDRDVDRGQLIHARCGRRKTLPNPVHLSKDTLGAGW